jgi:catechol 2,3-dioxygenase-like lactoylglutathione lyase family enzyme
MAKLECLSSVGIFTRDQKKARSFYTRKVGLTVRSATPRFGYLALGATKGGDDASLDVWQPEPAWGPMYETGMKQIGTVTGIGFLSPNLTRTVEGLRRKGVEVEVTKEAGGEDFARIKDPDGNVFFASEDSKAAVRRPGLSRMEYVTVVTRDAARARDFFTKALGLKARKAGGFDTFRVGPKGTAIMPFVPTREMYEDPKDYDADMAHVGEDTSITFETSDASALQEQLMGRGVRFSQKAQHTEWGGILAKFLDPDDNVYQLLELMD